MAVTLRDVAARAGVSPVVVSRVLHNKAQAIRVSDATAERVRQAAEELGYRCNVAARNFRAQQTMTIGILHGSGFARPKLNEGSRYFACLMDGLIEGAFRNGYSVTLCPQLLSDAPESAMGDGRFDGLVWYSSVSSDANLGALARCSVPLVLIHSRTAQFGSRHSAVLCDNEQGIGGAVEHLVELGHRRLAFAMDVSPLNLESLDRLAVFRRHCALHGIETGDRDVLEVGWDRREVDSYFRGGLRHTALIAHNDGLAAEFLNRAKDFDIDVPGQFSIVGFDSTSFCDELRPTLTSISQPLREMGECAIDFLVRTIQGELPEPVEQIFPCGLDIRESTAIVGDRT
ncbi:MAG TPA: LacI family DNA-binding transcriptional regulator [Fimbriimonadaceae bacterium]|nr:LacI family DNA-binding transcriptional regulator [Fimbriimonadaceae bacterium]